jgi:release factor glutamine methyltransferase
VPTTRELLVDAGDRLRQAGVPSPEVDAELLLAHVTQRPRALLRMAGTEVRDDAAGRFAELVELRARRIPLQHLTGLAPFRRIELRVGPGVFIPRPETELLVDEVLAHLAGRPWQGRGPAGIVDLCTGSGALAIALALEVPGSRVAAVEVSEEALGWARSNVDEHADAIRAVGSRLDLVAADATTVARADGPLAGMCGQADVVVTNPPYVPKDAVPREPEVRDHDPALALYGGHDGLEVVRDLARQAALLLRPGGLLVVEHADVQGEAAQESGVPALLRGQPDPASESATALLAWREVADHLDLAGLPRYTSAIRTGHPQRPAAGDPAPATVAGPDPGRGPDPAHGRIGP